MRGEETGSDAAAPVQAPTERRNPRSLDLDLMSTAEVLRLLNEEDRTVPVAVERVLPEIARVVDLAAAALSAGHTVHYFGAGSSGRIAAADAAELGPTFGLAEGRVVAHLAGGGAALTRALEGVEDDADAARAEAGDLGPGDLVIGIAASGRTPYVAGALQAARAAGAATVLVSSHPLAPLAPLADVHVCTDTGPEVLTGSTRMKAASAQKLVLNAISTATMIRLGRTYSNLMSGVQASNAKLVGRTVGILAEASGADLETCRRTLAEADGDLAESMVVLLGGVGHARARSALDAHDGVVRAALEGLRA